MSEDTDPTSRFISLIIPVAVAECAKRMDYYRRTTTRGDNMEFIDRVSDDILKECNFDPNITLRASSANASDLTPVQNLKLELSDLYQECVNDIIVQVGDSVKEELRMEIFLELDKMRSEMMSQPKSTVKKEFGGSIMPSFSTEFGPRRTVNNVVGGQASIANISAFGARGKSQEDIEKSLEDNPLFARINKNLGRFKEGKAAYTPEELVAARGTRFDEETADEFMCTAKKSKFEYDEPYKEDEDAMWDKLFDAKFAN